MYKICIIIKCVNNDQLKQQQQQNVMHIYKISIFVLQFKIFKRVLKILISQITLTSNKTNCDINVLFIQCFNRERKYKKFQVKKIIYDLYSTRSSTYVDIQIFAYNEILGQAFKNLNSSKLNIKVFHPSSYSIYNSRVSIMKEQ